jgi:hypothetical protein
MALQANVAEKLEKKLLNVFFQIEERKSHKI